MLALSHDILTFILVAAALLCIIGYCAFWAQSELDMMRESRDYYKGLYERSEMMRISIVKELQAYKHVGYSIRAVADELGSKE